MSCEWFDQCDDPSMGLVEHPTLGDVPICEKHTDWLLTDYSPTKMIPPIAARAAAKLRANLARAETDYLDTPGAVGRCDTCGAVEVETAGAPCQHYGTPAYALN